LSPAHAASLYKFQLKAPSAATLSFNVQRRDVTQSATEQNFQTY